MAQKITTPPSMLPHQLLSMQLIDVNPEHQTAETLKEMKVPAPPPPLPPYWP